MSTIKDVAKEAGVSIATVSRVLNSRDNLTEKTIQKVLSAMEKLNYHPNAVARSLVKGSYKCIGIMLPSLITPFWSQMAHELELSALKYGYSIMITYAPSNIDAYIEAYESLSRSISNGIITSFIRGTENFIHQSMTPTVVIGNTDCSPSVSSNDLQGGLLATRHLIAKGCKNLIHISGDLRYSKSANDRSYAFIQECERQHVAFKVYQVTSEEQSDLDFSGIISNIFSENISFDGIFASNDILATNCISTSLSLGYRIPEDIHIIGYDGIYVSALIYPSLSTIRQNFHQLAETAVVTLLTVIDGKEVPPKQIIPVELVERKST
jgi:DNA-binding LacI/PurR family transcriptional regulator